MPTILLFTEGELRKVWEAVQQDPQLKTHLNCWLVGCAIGLILAGVGCCPTLLSMEGCSEDVKKWRTAPISVRSWEWEWERLLGVG
jgi:hypothetical protein